GVSPSPCIELRPAAEVGSIPRFRHSLLRTASMPLFFFFTSAATAEIYTLSLHDALPISVEKLPVADVFARDADLLQQIGRRDVGDRKSTRLNSSHDQNSYAVFCLKKKSRRTMVKPQSAFVGSCLRAIRPGALRDTMSW